MNVPSLPASALLLLVTVAAAQQPAPPPPHHLVVVDLQSQAELDRLMALDVDLASCSVPEPGTHEVEVIATDADLARLQASGLSVRVAQRDLETFYAQRAAQAALESPVAAASAPSTLSPPLGQGSMGGHYTLAEMESILDAFAQSFPQICSQKVSIGTSVEGRALWMVKISDNVNVKENEPEVLYDALHHAREPASMETTLLFMDRLLNGYGTDPEATYLVNERELYFVPCVNPDGYEYNRQTNPKGGGLWRKNREGGYGIDLNRNYPTGFGGSGSSGRRSSETYRGPSALSEPETAALDAFASQHQFVANMSAHTYSDILLRPWGYKSGNPSNFADYDRVGRIMTAQDNIPFGGCYSLLYPAAGISLDHLHAAHGAFGWSAELGNSNEGFWPTPQQTVSIANRHQDLFRKMALLAGPALQDAEIVLITDGSLGSTMEIGMLGQPGAQAVLAVSTGTGNVALPGITNPLRLDPASLTVLPPITLPASGYGQVSFTIPSNPALHGATLWWQMLQQNEGLLLGDPESMTLQ